YHHCCNHGVNINFCCIINYRNYFYDTTFWKGLIMIISYLLILFILIVDIVTKQVFSSIYGAEQVEVICAGILIFCHVQNRGASSGMLERQPFIVFLVPIFALGLFGYLFSKSNLNTKKVYTISLILLISGTLGNAIARLFYGYVID